MGGNHAVLRLGPKNTHKVVLSAHFTLEWNDLGFTIQEALVVEDQFGALVCILLHWFLA